MFRFSQFAAPVILGAAMAIGAGCASEEHPQNIPLNAREMGEARETISYAAPENGTVYIEDTTAHKLVYSGEVKKGQMVKVDAKANEVTIDNQLATKTDLINDHKFAIYFDKSNPGSEAETSGQRINIQEPQSNNNGQGATITTPGGTRVTTPNDTTVTVPQNNANNGTTVTIPQNNNQSGSENNANSSSNNNGETTVTTPNGTVIRQHSSDQGQ